MISKMGISTLPISWFFTFGCILISRLAFTCANEQTLKGKIGEIPVMGFSSVERNLKLICDLKGGLISNATKPESPQWSFFGKGNITVANVSSTCEGKRKKGDPKPSISTSALDSDCQVSFDGETKHLVLELMDIGKNEFGKYVCHTGDMNRSNKTFILKEIVHLSRKIVDGKKIKIEKSLIVQVGNPLAIYCNASGLNEHQHEISWWKDGEDITEALNEGLDIFQNFTAENSVGLSFVGPAMLEHRGNYTCQVDTNDTETMKFYPVKFSFYVRVKEGTEWKLPLYVFLGECGLIGLFTLIINWRESRIKEDDIVIEDSEDEDDDVPKKSVNGNNNSNGK